jgi:DNA-binding response OmpR family regulator
LKEKKWILIIEDEEELANLIGEKLFKEGYDFIYSPTAQNAKFKLDNQEFICLLLDMNLAQGSGEDIIKHLTRGKDVFNANTPIIVISGSLDNSRISDIKDRIAGAIVKPFSMESLIAKIKSTVKTAHP